MLWSMALLSYMIKDTPHDCINDYPDVIGLEFEIRKIEVTRKKMRLAFKARRTPRTPEVMKKTTCGTSKSLKRDATNGSQM